MDPQGLTEHCPDEELDRLSALLGQVHGAHLEEFCTEWMHMVRRYDRKHWSYHGAVRGQRGRLAEFDPGNGVYAKVLGLLCPAYMRTVGRNIYTKGDICEALLALSDDFSSLYLRDDGCLNLRLSKKPSSLFNVMNRCDKRDSHEVWLNRLHCLNVSFILVR